MSSLINYKHLMKATKHSLAGLQRAWQAEQAFRHEVLLFPIILLLLFVLRPGAVWSAALIAAWLLVMAVELLNSAIEEAFNLISPEYNLLVKYGKDMASAAIFLALVINGILWLAMLWVRFIG